MHLLRIGNKWSRQKFNMVSTEQFKAAIFGAKSNFEFLRRRPESYVASRSAGACVILFVVFHFNSNFVK